jgi:hypothetical protein
MISTAALVASDCPDVWRDAIRSDAGVRSENFISGRRLQSQASNNVVHNIADQSRSSHQSVSVTPQQHGAKQMSLSSKTTTKNLRISRNEVADQLRLAVNNAIPQHVETAKAAAQKIECSPRTVEALRQRVPDAMVTVAMLGLAYPEFAISMAQMWGIDVDDPKGYALFISMQRHAMRRVRGE